MEAQVSEHITLVEATKSPTAEHDHIDNTPTEEIFQNMRIVAAKCFEPLRTHFAVPFRINSFYRCPVLNHAIGGAATSQHTEGKAIDIDSITPGITNLDIYNWLKDNVEFDQLILESPDANGVPAWVHVSFNTGNNRRMRLKMVKVNGVSTYQNI